jgi:hypothetical protein
MRHRELDQSSATLEGRSGDVETSPRVVLAGQPRRSTRPVASGASISG